jgi:Zn-dependent M16 (insulinase) family peptidase
MPDTPAAMAFRSFLSSRIGFGPDAQTAFREAVGSLTMEDVRRAASEHLSGPGAKASLTSAEMAEDAGFFDVVRGS